MSCPHGHGPPERCSQCLGVAPKRIDQSGADLTIDGEPARTIAPAEMPLVDYYRRGGRHARKAKP